MARRKAFTQADVHRALKGACAAGLKIGRIEIDQLGKIVIISADQDAARLDPQSSLDAWRTKRHARPT